MIRKLLSKLNLLERIGLFLTVLYGTGVILLVQHSAMYLGFEDIDFLRLKPILVGLQYFIYILAPLVVCVMPFIVSRMCFARRIYRLTFACALVVLALVMIPIMVHYFMPCIGLAAFHGVTWWWIPVIGNFWSLYFYWDLHLVGHTMLLASEFLLAFQLHKSSRYRLRKICRMGICFLVLIGSAWLMYYFNRDFYMNISQAAGGGAPKAGIITIREPSHEMSRSNLLYANDDEEISKPCFLLYEGDDYVLTSEMFLEHRHLKSLNENSIVRSVSRVEKSRVVEFSPISYHQMWREGNASILTNTISGDVIHHLGLSAVGIMIPVGSGLCADVNADWRMTNMPEMVLWIDDEGSLRTRASRVSLSPSQETNLVCHMEFSSIPCNRGIQIWQWERLMTNSIPNVGLRIEKLPMCPNGYQWDRMVLQFRCNFIYSFDLPWERVITDNKVLVARKKGNPK